MAEPGDAAAFIDGAPFEVLKALLGALSPKWILRMRLVCRAWREKLGNRALLTRLNRDEPPQPLLCFDRAACPDYYIHLSDYRVESLDLRSGELHAVFRFTDNENYFIDQHDLHGTDAPPINDDDDDEDEDEDDDDDDDHFPFPIDYKRMVNYGEADFRPQVTIHVSLDGYLLVSFSALRRWYIVNPATRQWVPLFDPTKFRLIVVGFYEHGPSGKYRALCVRLSNPVLHEAAPTYEYEVIEARPGQRRHIGRPVSPAAHDRGLRFGVERSSVSPPIQWKRNMDLLWTPQATQGFHMLVFDTHRERFSWKRPPPVILFGQEWRLLEFPDGDLGLSVSRANDATLELWRLQDYQNEVWVLNRRIQLALQQMPALQIHGGHPWVPAVVSAEGDVLIESRRHGLFHCDRDGNLLRRLWFNQPQSSHRRLPIRHVLRRSLVRHPMFEPPQNAAREPPFFRWLCSDEW